MFETDKYGFLTEDGLITTLLCDTNYAEEFDYIREDYKVNLNSFVNFVSFNESVPPVHFLGIFVDEHKILDGLIDNKKIIRDTDFYIVWKTYDALIKNDHYEISSFGPNFERIGVFDELDHNINQRENFYKTIRIYNMIEGIDLIGGLPYKIEQINDDDYLYKIDNLEVLVDKPVMKLHSKESYDINEIFKNFLKQRLEIVGY